jgi:hypothetical protein
MGARGADGTPFASELALEFPGEAILIQQVLAPALEALLPVAEPVRRGAEAAAVDAMAAEVQRLRETISQHEEAIRRLENR